MKKYCDLHIHSKYSGDGQHSIKEIVKILNDENVTIAAITDHNKIQGTFEFKKISDDQGIRSIPGVELSTRGKHHENIHLLLYNIRKIPELENDLDIINNQYMKLSQLRITKLNELGFFINMKDVLSEKIIIPSMGPTIGAAILHNRKNDNDPRLKKYREIENGDYKFYIDFLKNKKSKAFIEFKEYSVYNALSVAKKNDFISVIAHPSYSLRHFDRAGQKDFVKDLVKHGMQGIEVYSSHHSKEDIVFFKKLCKKYDLQITGGSDFHGEITKPHITVHKYKVESNLLRIDKILDGV
ncbi:PHP domain-containing protein [bacterium]|nr:PHP domain-containing protein [bacterium]